MADSWKASLGSFGAAPYKFMCTSTATLLQNSRLLVHWEAESHQKVPRDICYCDFRQASCVLHRRAFCFNSDKRINHIHNIFKTCCFFYLLRELNCVFVELALAESVCSVYRCGESHGNLFFGYETVIS